LFQNRALRKIFEPKWEEVAGGWRRLHNEELHNNLYTSPNIIRVIKSGRMTWARHVARMGQMRNGCTILVEKPEGKRPFRKPRRRFEDNIRMCLRGIQWKVVDWIYLPEDSDM
jgi:hypothetical protein